MQSIINALNNRLLLKKLHRSAIQRKDIQEFRKIIQGIDFENERGEPIVSVRLPDN